VHSLVLSDRLELRAFTTRLISAFIANDRLEADSETNATFPVPFAPPPETGDVLEYFRSMLVADTSDGLFVPRLIITRGDRTVVGSIGVNPPDTDGVSLTGYSVYPLYEGNGYASEAAKSLVDYAFAVSPITTVRATIEISNRASQIVAARAGLTETGQQIEEEGMELSIWERNRDQS
jgi:RimJ/RimL family protein N-acetyltransferase